MSNFLNKKLKRLKNTLNESSDVGDRIFKKEGQTLAFVFLKSIINQELLSSAIYFPLQTFEKELTVDNIKDSILKVADAKIVKEDEVVGEILNGKVVIFADFDKRILSIDLYKVPVRLPAEPPTSPVLQGPREGFVEDYQTNMTLLRRRIKSPNLVFNTMEIGSQSQTKVTVCYIKGIAKDEIVEKVTNKLKNIKIDGILDSYYVLSFLEERPNSLFKQIGNSEKPDIVCAKMLEGKVAIIVDNSPIVLTIPFIFIEDLQSSNDYYTNHHYSSLVRMIRLIGLLIAVVASGFYISLQLYHYNIIPLNFLVTIADTTQGLPFTPFLEILFIFLLFQILYEVSLRLPSYLGLATSVVGALILGDTGVKAGLISPPAVIIVALSKIALYTIPEESSQITVLQFIFIIIGGSLGLAGIIAGMVYIINYLNTIDSYGTPYLAPYSPRIPKDLKDAILATSPTQIKNRPRSFSPKDEVRK
ncbi:MAG: spore germination protein [Clostridia bacterium]|nr:spore germination protein [Clostridia bacterium]MBQ8792020.1 spore germination protein [Clostridia bacterium]